mgnify:CR=1 FL=1
MRGPPDAADGLFAICCVDYYWLDQYQCVYVGKYFSKWQNAIMDGVLKLILRYAICVAELPISRYYIHTALLSRSHM